MLRLNILTTGGDAEVEFDDLSARVRWNDTTATDRKMVKALVAKARKLGLEPHSVDESGRVSEDKTKKLPGAVFNRRGEVALMGDALALRKLAKLLIEEEIVAGRMVMQAQKDGSWKVLRKGEFEPPEEGEKATVASAPKVRGG